MARDESDKCDECVGKRTKARDAWDGEANHVSADVLFDHKRT
jgi:hypothetical protein